MYHAALTIFFFLFCLGVIYGAICDARTYTIPNRVPYGLAGLFAVYAALVWWNLSLAGAGIPRAMAQSAVSGTTAATCACAATSTLATTPATANRRLVIGVDAVGAPGSGCQNAQIAEMTLTLFRGWPAGRRLLMRCPRRGMHVLRALIRHPPEVSSVRCCLQSSRSRGPSSRTASSEGS